ncbi:MAG: DUF448 domain-containing protein [Deltaproteobacteria bacterium]|jgi:predicted RNA-binding protein YlxR (DUF448 family)|nr:DUF448 domain-containing protein [Deltaproteobacteria bacterium]
MPPVRTCVACRRKGDPASLTLLTLVPGPGGKGGEAVPHPGGPRQGRGAWVCREGPCLRRLARRPRLLDKAFRAEGVTLRLPPEGGHDKA